MGTKLRRFRNGALASALVAVFAFGAAQAAAGPAPAADEAARACNPTGCNAACTARGGFEGQCNNGQCLCLF